MCMSEFLRTSREVRARLSIVATFEPLYLMIKDGLPWEAPKWGSALEPGAHARVRGADIGLDAGTDFVVMLLRRYSETHWRISVDDDSSSVDLALRDGRLRRIYADLDRDDRAAEYFLSQERLGCPVSYCPAGVDWKPV